MQLAEALVAVSEGLAAVNDDETVSTPHVVAVEETASSAMTPEEAVIQQVSYRQGSLRVLGNQESP